MITSQLCLTQLFVICKEKHVLGHSSFMTLMPHWTGGHPSEGGGFDKAILRQLSQLKSGDIVKIKWEHSEHNRILAIQKL